MVLVITVHVLQINPAYLTHPTKAPRVIKMRVMLKSFPDFICSLQLRLTLISASLCVLGTVCGVQLILKRIFVVKFVARSFSPRALAEARHVLEPRKKKKPLHSGKEA